MPLHSNNKIVVLGFDAVSPLGTDLEVQWQRACAGESGIGKLTRFPLRKDFPVQIAGEVPEMDITPFAFLQPRPMAHWTSPVFKYGMLVVHRALRRAGLEISKELAPRVAITFSSAIGGLDAVIDADRILVKDNRYPMPFVNPNSCINMVAGKISILTGATGPITTTVTACATGASSMLIGAMFIRAGMADVAICGAVDFPLVEPIVAGFATMNGAFKTKAEKPDSPDKASRPFSKGRRGFVISEGAGCILLSSEEFAKNRGLPVCIELAGWSSTSDAHHFVAPHLATVTRCMTEAIAHAGISPSDIDALNAHAASTKVGDLVEAQALREVFGIKIPWISANKSQLGHAMGASSAIESVLAMQGMFHNTILPTLNYSPDPELPLVGVAEKTIQKEQEFVLKNAFGFGGCNTCLVFRRVG